jgi:hypothetical protein
MAAWTGQSPSGSVSANLNRDRGASIGAAIRAGAGAGYQRGGRGRDSLRGEKADQDATQFLNIHA